jgi:arylsulfatase A-like enzyme
VQTQNLQEAGLRRGAFFGAAVIVLAAVALLVWRLIPATPPDILLITIDTLRADVLEPYGATDTETPNIARLAEHGVVYDAATTPIPLTRPAHASILTGLYPDQHGVLTNHQILPKEPVSITQILEQAGYQTAGFTGVRFLNQRSGLARGFDTFHAPKTGDSIRGKDVVDRARTWLEGSDPKSPLFLWVHLYDPHQPYNPLRTFRRDIDPKLEEQLPSVNFRSLNRVARRRGGDISDDILKLTLDYYRYEVEYTDFWVGRLLQNFERVRASRPSMIIFTADHGECFENGIYFEHADCLYEGALRVPLIVRYPVDAGGGSRAHHRVSLLDVTPSILFELGLPIHDTIAGLPLQTGGAETTHNAVLVRLPERHQPNRTPSRLRAIRSVGGKPVAPETDWRTRGVVDLLWKYLTAPQSQHLFLLPDERVNRVSVEEEVRHRLQRSLDEISARYPARVAAPLDHDPETLEALEALGYVE